MTRTAGRWGVLAWGFVGACLAGVLPAGGAELAIKIVERGTDRALPARVRVRDATGKDLMPEGGKPFELGTRDRWFMSDGESTLAVPAGRVEIRVERGLEYVPFKESITVPAEAPFRHRIELDRWVDMRSRGYVCGENHLHVAAQDLAPMVVAEGLDFGTSLQWWNGPKFEVPTGEGFVRDLRFAGRTVPTSIYDVEIEHSWGAIYLVGMPSALEEKVQRSRPNLIIARPAHNAGALVSYQAGWSREVLVDALLGCVDVVNVCNNNFHRHRFQPRSRYSNLLEVPGFPVYPATDTDMMRMNTESYYRLLNCGLRLAAGAESATGAKPNPVGYNRSYVRAGEKPTLRGFLEAWRKGRNFVTNGPMIFLKVSGKHEPGDILALPAEGAKLTIRAEALSDQPLTSLEVVVNGKVLAAPAVGGGKAEWATELSVSEPCWIAARCTADDGLLSDEELAAYDDGEQARPSRLRFAHTSPVYVTVGGKNARVDTSVKEAGQMLDAFDTFAARTAGARYREEIADAVRKARTILEAGK